MDVIAQVNRADTVLKLRAAFIGFHLHVKRANRCFILGIGYLPLMKFLTLAKFPRRNNKTDPPGKTLMTVVTPFISVSSLSS